MDHTKDALRRILNPLFLVMWIVLFAGAMLVDKYYAPPVATSEEGR